jgi:DNA modification methylase
MKPPGRPSDSNDDQPGNEPQGRPQRSSRPSPRIGPHNGPHPGPYTGRVRPEPRPPLRIFTTTLWEYPSQHYDAWVDDEGQVHKTKHRPTNNPISAMQGDRTYVGATPSWIIWQVLSRYTRPGDLIIDPCCGSGTTLDVCDDLGRKSHGFDLVPTRPDIRKADARKLPLPDASADFVFIDPPYSTHVDYSDDPNCIGKLSAGGEDGGSAYYHAMDKVVHEMHRVLKDRRYAALYVSDSFKKRKVSTGGGGGEFMPIGFELFALMTRLFKPVDIIAVVRGNQKLARGNWRKAAEEGNFFLRGFNYLFIVKKQAN